MGSCPALRGVTHVSLRAVSTQNGETRFVVDLQQKSTSQQMMLVFGRDGSEMRNAVDTNTRRR